MSDVNIPDDEDCPPVEMYGVRKAGVESNQCSTYLRLLRFELAKLFLQAFLFFSGERMSVSFFILPETHVHGAGEVKKRATKYQ